MAITRASGAGLLSGRKPTRLVPAPDDEWVRPSDWLALPSVVAGTPKFVGLFAVYPGNSNWVAVSFAAAHTIDWGDGSAPVNVATGVTTSHNFAYADVSGTDCSRGYRQAIVTVTPQAANNLTTINLVPTRPTGMVSGWSNGWLDIKIAGANVTNLNVSNNTTSAAMLERFEYVGPSSITNASTSIFSTCRSLQKVIGTTWTSTMTTFSSMFLNCSLLRTIPLLDTGAGVTFSSMFFGCSSLRSIPLLNTAVATSFTSMFSLCVSLQTIPLINTGAGTLVNNMFESCSSLQTIPLLNTANATSFNAMFNLCTALVSVPALNMASATNVTSMFSSCTSLQSAPLAGTTRSISYASAKLKGTELDAIYTGLATVNTNLLSANASSIETNNSDWTTGPVNCVIGTTSAGFPGGDGVNSVKLTSSASGEATAAIGTRLAVSASTAYTFMAWAVATTTTRTCRVKIGWYDAGGALISTSAGADASAPTVGFTQQYLCQATSPVGAVTASVILSFTASAASQVVQFDKMGLFPGTVTAWTIGGAQTITVTSNWDTANDTPSIATNKGWTVTGS